MINDEDYPQVGAGSIAELSDAAKFEITKHKVLITKMSREQLETQYVSLLTHHLCWKAVARKIMKKDLEGGLL